MPTEWDPTREMHKYKSVRGMQRGGYGGSATLHDLNNRSGQLLGSGRLRYKRVGANQSSCSWGLMNAEKNDPSRWRDSTNMFSRVKATHDGHRQVKNHNVGREFHHLCNCLGTILCLTTDLPLIAAGK